MDLIEAVSTISKGESLFSPSIARLMLDEHVRYMTGERITDRYESLSDRGREVFQLIGAAKLPLSAKISGLCTKF